MKVALGVSGGIACYKSAEILRRLQDRGVEVVVLMTKGATQFVTPLTFRALSGNKVYVDIFEGARSGADFEGAFDHILVAHSTDLFLVAPATADCIARLAIGLADDFLTTFHLAVTAPVVVAPAMNTRMWEHASVRANIETLKNRGVHIIEPEVGQMACRTYGPGRLAPVEEIVEVVMGILTGAGIWKGVRSWSLRDRPSKTSIPSDISAIGPQEKWDMRWRKPLRKGERRSHWFPAQLRTQPNCIFRTPFMSARPRRCGVPSWIMRPMPRSSSKLRRRWISGRRRWPRKKSKRRPRISRWNSNRRSIS